MRKFRDWLAATLPSLLLVLIPSLAAPGQTTTTAHAKPPHASPALSIEVSAGAIERIGKIVEVELETAQLPSSGEKALTLVEVNEQGGIVDRHVPFQLDQGEAANPPLLTFLLSGGTPAKATRRFRLQRATEAVPPLAPQVQVEEVAEYEGFPAFRITTPAATYYYHVGGSGFASLIDREGHDWISHHPEGGFQGSYRGIPNVAPPEFHPGPGKGKKESRLIRSGPLRASILSETEDGAWSVVWDIFPAYANMTLLKKSAAPYWILYEGTPGGSFDTENDYWVQSTGKRLPVAPNDQDNFWEGTLPSPQWVYFGDEKLRRVLFLALREADDFPDEFWHRGSGSMTVFGFGRGPRPQWQYMQTVPTHLTIGLVESSDFGEVKRRIESA
ncbi:MAG: hypothetical protein WD733_08395 [Bryobacterales bacterium]